jgi:hypothetical protein
VKHDVWFRRHVAIMAAARASDRNRRGAQLIWSPGARRWAEAEADSGTASVYKAGALVDVSMFIIRLSVGSGLRAGRSERVPGNVPRRSCPRVRARRGTAAVRSRGAGSLGCRWAEYSRVSRIDATRLW